MFSDRGVLARCCPELYSTYGENFSYENSNCPAAEDISGRIVNLFTDPELSQELRDQICTSIKKVTSHYER